VIAATPALSDFKAAIDGAGMQQFFTGTKPYTYFVPDNDAMASASSVDVTDYLTQGALTAAQIFQKQEIGMQSGEVFPVDAATQQIGDGVMSASRDIKVSNGLMNVMAGLIAS
jgi:uncharacterized surface protein with fasciclin (FAS1) repeats